MEFVVEKIEEYELEDIAAVLNLFRGIPGRTCTAANYAEYLYINWINICLVVVRKDGKIVGFTQGVAPNLLEPQTAWLPYSHALPECPHSWSIKAVELVEEWMAGFGATKFKLVVTRSTRAFEKRWAPLEVSNEILMEKVIS